MTQSPNDAPQILIVDPGNGFLGPDYPAQLVTSRVPTDHGERMCMTVRCGPATVSVLMTKADGERWAKQIAAEAGQMSSLIVPNVQIKPNGQKIL